MTKRLLTMRSLVAMMSLLFSVAKTLWVGIVIGMFYLNNAYFLNTWVVAGVVIQARE